MYISVSIIYCNTSQNLIGRSTELLLINENKILASVALIVCYA